MPIICSSTITDRSGRILSGQTLEALHISIAHARPLAVSLNCALGADDMRPYVEELSRISPFFTSCYPNAGLPNEFGEYDDTPEHMAGLLGRVRPRGLAQPGRRLLRHPARAHRRHRRGGGRRGARGCRPRPPA